MSVDHQAFLSESQVPPGRTDPRSHLRHRETLLPYRDEAAAHCGCADHTLLHVNGMYCGYSLGQSATIPFKVHLH